MHCAGERDGMVVTCCENVACCRHICTCARLFWKIVGMMCHFSLDLKSVGARPAYFNISQVVKVQLSLPYV